MAQAYPETLEQSLSLLREATRNTSYEGTLYLVGGLIRDRELGSTLASDLDIVLEGDAVALVHFLHRKGITQHVPVTYPRFGTAMVHIGHRHHPGIQVEFVSARAESYQSDSRKPHVRQGTLKEDAFRRDFTLNTLMENLHTGEILDLTGKGRDDLKQGIIRTPLDPRITFYDDPLRMLRAIRFGARFGFQIAPETWEAMQSEAYRLAPPAISQERIRDEFVKIILLSGKRFRQGMELLLEAQLLPLFLPEMLPMIDCTQGSWHPYDVWKHTLVALEALPDSAPFAVRLALLWHDIGKPNTRTEENGIIRFTNHPKVGAEIVQRRMTLLKFPNEEIKDVVALVRMHMRLGEYRPDWTDASIRRLIRETHPYLEDLFLLTECDRSAVRIPPDLAADLVGLRARVEAQNALMNVAEVISPLNGDRIMELLGIPPGITLKNAKEFLTNQVLEGNLKQYDQEGAAALLLEWWQKQH